jgi:hypothetical protein
VRCRYLAVASKDDMATAGAGVDVQRDESHPHCHDTVLRYVVTLQVCTHPKMHFNSITESMVRRSRVLVPAVTTWTLSPSWWRVQLTKLHFMQLPAMPVGQLIWIKRVVAYEYELIYILRRGLQFGLESELHKWVGNSSKLKRITLNKHLRLETTNQLKW